MARQTVFFATNRNPLPDPTGKITDFGSDLGPVSGLNVRYGSAAVDVDLTARSATLVAGSVDVADETLVVPQNSQPKLGSQTIFDQVRMDMKAGGRPTLAVIHGF